LPRGRRRRARGVKTLDTSLSPSTQSSKSSKKRTSHRGVRPRASVKIDPVKLLESMVDDIASRLGLDLLGLSREQLIEALRPVIEGLLERYSSRPSKDAIISRIIATSKHVYVLVSAYLLEKFDKLTPEQLEFVASYGEGVAAKYMPRLYREAKRLGREDLIPLLRAIWERYGSPTPIACPYCGFRAVTPDLVCMVCGRELSEKEIKEAIDFREKLVEFVELYSPRDVEEAIEKGYVVVGESIKPPSMQPERGEVVLHLSKDERNLLKSLLVEKKEVMGSGEY